MLQHLHIQNFAIIEEEKIQFSQGFTTLTGETGAGKSIILDAIMLLLGGRANADMVRRGKTQARVKGLFYLEGHQKHMIEARLASLNLPIQEHGLLEVERMVSLKGKNRTKINQTTLRVSHLKGLMQGLVEIIRQHESYTLLDPEQHLHLIDAFGGLKEEAQSLYQDVERWQSLELEQRKLKKTQDLRQQRIDYLSTQIDRINRISPQKNEDDQIDRDLRLLHAAERLNRWIDEGIYTLYDRSPSVLDEVSGLESGLDSLIDVDERLGLFFDALGRAKLELEELTHDLRRFKGEIPTDSDLVSELETRRNQLEQLKQDYDASLEDIIEQLNGFQAEKSELESLDQRIVVAQIEAKEAQANALLKAQLLSKKRVQLAKQLGQLVEHELKTLGMAQCRFKVHFSESRLTRTGLDQIEFLISPNPGEGFKGLARIASGGELSRLTLALKVVLMHNDQTPTYVFDEVDSGIGGGVAEGVGWKLKRIASDRQVVCITHLPQVSSCADHHMKIEKILLKDRTFSSIRALDEKERMDEVARMLGGQDMTDATFAHAQEMIERGRREVPPHPQPIIKGLTKSKKTIKKRPRPSSTKVSKSGTKSRSEKGSLSKSSQSRDLN